jgi:ubiquinone biosynthesis protein Coq4
MKKTLRKVKAWLSALLLFRDPNRLNDVFVLEEATADTDVAAESARRALAHPAGARAAAERYRLPPIDLEALAALPEGTFGRVFSERMRAQGIDPAAIPRREAADDAEYVRAHLYETHDLWHVALGFDTDIPGELGVQAVYAAQVGGALAPLLVTGGLLQALVLARNDWPARVDAVVRGWELGRRARPLFGVRWHELYAAPLTDVRAQLGLS